MGVVKGKLGPGGGGLPGLDNVGDRAGVRFEQLDCCESQRETEASTNIRRTGNPGVAAT